MPAAARRPESTSEPGNAAMKLAVFAGGAVGRGSESNRSVHGGSIPPARLSPRLVAAVTRRRFYVTVKPALDAALTAHQVSFGLGRAQVFAAAEER